MSDSPNKLSQFWQELKRRKVVRVITVYAAASFVILELVSIIVEPLKLPEWFLTAVIVFLCIGFIIAVILSWIYDIRPEGGIVKTETVHEGRKEEVPSSSNRWKVASYVSFVVIIALIIFNVIPRTGKKEILDKSIAVRPFWNESTEKENESFVNGMTEDIRNSLAKIADLRVISRGSVEKYRDSDDSTLDIARDLNVTYVLEGTAQRIDDQVKIHVQLILAENDDHIWEKTYRDEIKNVKQVYDIQSKIAQSVANEIKVIITPEEKQLIEKISTTSLTAYDFYQRASQEADWDMSVDEAVLERAIYLCYSALEYDSSFAHPYSLLAWLYGVLSSRNPFEYTSYLDSMIYYADKALSFDNKHERGYYIRGNYYRILGQHDRAIEDFDKAIEINPNFWEAYDSKGWLHFANNDFIKSIENFSKVIQLNRGPRLANSLASLGFAYNQAGFPEKYKEFLREKLTLDKDTLDFYKRYANADISAGNYREAIETTFKAYELDTMDHEIWEILGRGYFHLRQFNESFTYFSKYVTRMEELNQFVLYHIPQIAYTYLQIGDKEKSDYYIKKLINYNDITSKEANISGRILRLSHIYVIKGDIESTYEELSKYAQLERFTAWDNTLRDSPIYDMINTEPEFLQIISEIERKYAVQHERVKQWLEENDML